MSSIRRKVFAAAAFLAAFSLAGCSGSLDETGMSKETEIAAETESQIQTTEEEFERQPQTTEEDFERQLQTTEEDEEETEGQLRAQFGQMNEEQKQELAQLLLPYLGPFETGKVGKAEYMDPDLQVKLGQRQSEHVELEIGQTEDKTLPVTEFTSFFINGQYLDAKGNFELHNSQGDFQGYLNASFCLDPEEASGFRLYRMESGWIPVTIDEDGSYCSGDILQLYSPLVIYASGKTEHSDYYEFEANMTKFNDTGGYDDIALDTTIRLRKGATVYYNSAPGPMTIEEFLGDGDSFRILFDLKQDEKGYITEFQDMNAG